MFYRKLLIVLACGSLVAVAAQDAAAWGRLRRHRFAWLLDRTKPTASKSAQPPILSAPARVISVGDDASVLHAFKEYGYSEESFSLPAFSPGPNGSRATPRFFHLGNNQYIWVWHGERIESITQFRAVPHEHAYTDFVDNCDLASITISGSRKAVLETIPYVRAFSKNASMPQPRMVQPKSVIQEEEEEKLGVPSQP